MIKKTLFIAILITILIVASASAYIIYNQYNNSPTSPSSSSSDSSTGTSSQSGNNQKSPSNSHSSSSSSSEQDSDSTTRTIIDGAGFRVNLPTTMQRIVVLDGNLAEMLCYMGLQNSIVGRTDSQCPPQLLNVRSVGEAAYALNVEVILELNPDIIIADSLLTYDIGGSYTLLKASGIPIYISQPPTTAQNSIDMTPEALYNDPTGIDIVCSVMQDLSTVVGNKDKVDAYVNWAQGYNKLVKDRVAQLPREQKPLAYVHWPYNNLYYTINDLKLYQAGGTNVAETVALANPVLSPEYLVEANPSVIIVLISSPTHSLKDFEAARNEVLNNPQLQGVDAVKNGCVYVSDFMALNGVRSIVGYLYYAKWVQPSLFSDIDPAAIAMQLNQQYLGTPTTDTYCYPR